MGRTKHLPTAKSPGNSPRGPSMDIDDTGEEKNLSDTKTDLLKTLASKGNRAIQELERVLFFTDLNDSQEAAKKGLDAVHDLQRVLFVSRFDNDSDAEDDKDDTTTIRATVPKSKNRAINKKPTTDTNNNSSSLALASTAASLTAILEILKAQFQSALKAGQQAGKTAWNELEVTRKEAERRFFLTDLDEEALRANGVTADVRCEMELVVKEVEETLSKYASSAQRQRIWEKMASSTQKVCKDMEVVYKECERALLFTDLVDRPALLDKNRSNEDVVTHFIKSQKVFQEMEERGSQTGMESLKLEQSTDA